MEKDDLFRAVLREMERVWGEDGFGGELVAYDWLYEHYGISERDDLHWQDILSHYADELPDSLGDLTEEEIAEVMEFVEDDTRVVRFLERLLEQYRSSTAVYPQKSEED
jgi:hypothetical protein